MNRSGLRRIWSIVACALVLFFVAGAPFFALPFLYPLIIEEFGWTREQATLLATFQFATAALTAIAVGRATDTFGAKLTVPLTIIVSAASMFGFLLVESLPTYYVLGIGLGISGPGCMVAVKAYVAKQFHRSLGLAIGVLVLGSGAAAFVVPLLFEWLIADFGWRAAMGTLGAGVLLVALPVWMTAERASRSADLPAEPAATSKTAPAAGVECSTISALARSKSLWLITVGLLLTSAADVGIYQHSVLFLKLDKGLPTSQVAVAISVFGLVALLARPCFGWLFDRLSFLGVNICYALVAISALLSFAVLDGVMTILWLVPLGVAHGALVVAPPILAKHRFGLHNLGFTIGFFTAVRQMGFAVGPWIMGRTFEVNGSYSLAFAFFVGACIVSCVMLAFVTPMYWNSVRIEYRNVAVPATRLAPRT